MVCQGVWFVKECGKALKRSLKWFYRQESEEDLKMERFGKGEEVWEEIMRMIWREMRTKVGTRNALVNAPLMPWLCDPDHSVDNHPSTTGKTHKKSTTVNFPQVCILRFITIC